MPLFSHLLLFVLYWIVLKLSLLTLTYFLFLHSCHSACQLRLVATSCLCMLTFWERNSFIHLFIHSYAHLSSQQFWPSSRSWGYGNRQRSCSRATARVYHPDPPFRITLLIPQVPGVASAPAPWLTPPGTCPWPKGAVLPKVMPFPWCTLHPMTGCCGGTKTLNWTFVSVQDCQKHYPSFRAPVGISWDLYSTLLHSLPSPCFLSPLCLLFLGAPPTSISILHTNPHLRVFSQGTCPTTPAFVKFIHWKRERENKHNK